VNADQVRTLCDKLGLGLPLGEPVSVSGGFLHPMWRLETGGGTVAIKDVTGIGLEDEYRRAEQIARLAAERGVQAPLALLADGSPIVRLRGAGHPKVLVYPWIEGAILPPGPVGIVPAARMGEALARIHAVAPHTLGFPPGSWSPPTLDLDDLLLIARRAERLGLAWAADLRQLRPEIALWYTRYRQVLPDLYRHQVLGHRDLDQKNVIWHDADTPVLIDWESAGMTNPTIELADVALNWSGVTAGEPDRETCAALLSAYLEQVGHITDQPRDALYAVLVNWLTWLRHAAGRVISLHHASADLQSRTGLEPIERQRVTHILADHAENTARFDREVTTTLATVTRIATNLDLYASWLTANEAQ
jgi:hypothetical protein